MKQEHQESELGQSTGSVVVIGLSELGKHTRCVLKTVSKQTVCLLSQAGIYPGPRNGYDPSWKTLTQLTPDNQSVGELSASIYLLVGWTGLS